MAGLTEIQSRGFRHLDIKPANILINTKNGEKNGVWNEKDLVIIDFGVGGRDDQKTGLAGTPGFSSPEQLIGNSHRKSDNYAFGKLMIMIFYDWSTAWIVMYQPVKDSDKSRSHRRIHRLIKLLLNVSLVY